MTEYDYSPDAVDRYIAKQHAIARWVDNTNRYEPGNPFLPSEPSRTIYAEPTPGTPEGDSQDGGYEDDYYRSSSHHNYRDVRDYHRRPHYDRHDSHNSRTSSRKDSRSSSSRPSRPHTSQAYQPSQPSPGNGQAYQYANGQQQYTQTTQYPYGSTSTPPLASPQPRTPYEHSTGGPTVVPIHGGAGGYFIVPPKGTTYQVVQAHSPAPGQPWYKRVFSPPPSEDSGRKLSKSSSSGSHKKRSNKWSLDIY